MFQAGSASFFGAGTGLADNVEGLIDSCLTFDAGLFLVQVSKFGAVGAEHTNIPAYSLMGDFDFLFDPKPPRKKEEPQPLQLEIPIEEPPREEKKEEPKVIIIELGD
jgi:hypothetical protein